MPRANKFFYYCKIFFVFLGTILFIKLSTDFSKSLLMALTILYVIVEDYLYSNLRYIINIGFIYPISSILIISILILQIFSILNF